MALSLGLERTYFDYFAGDPNGMISFVRANDNAEHMSSDRLLGICLCRSHHYLPTPKDAVGRTRGIGAHTDFGALTLLLQDTVGGLEVLHKKTGTWHPVPPVEGAYVVNIGDLMRECSPPKDFC